MKKSRRKIPILQTDDGRALLALAFVGVACACIHKLSTEKTYPKNVRKFFKDLFAHPAVKEKTAPK